MSEMNMPSIVISKLPKQREKWTNTDSELKEKCQHLAGSSDIDNFIERQVPDASDPHNYFTTKI